MEYVIKYIITDAINCLISDVTPLLCSVFVHFIAVEGSICIHLYRCYFRHTYADGSISNKVVDITSDQDVSVQGFNVEKFSADSYTILPWELAGQIHYILTYSPQHIQTQFAITTKVINTLLRTRRVCENLHSQKPECSTAPKVKIASSLAYISTFMHSS